MKKTVKPHAAKAAKKVVGTRYPRRNPGFPATYIKEMQVSLDDPDHWVRLEWTRR